MTVAAVPPPPTQTCPKCSFVSEPGSPECPACGVVLEKARAAEKQIESVREAPPSGSPLEVLAGAEHLTVKQEVERLEAWTGIETANQYTVRDGSGRAVLDVIEESDSAGQILGRLFLKSARPFTLQLGTTGGALALTMERPFRLWFHEISVHDAQGRLLGSVEREFAIVNKRYRVKSAGGESYEIYGPLFRPWTFKILAQGAECGQISKKWGGLVRESFTDADRFGVQLPPGIGVELKAVFLAAVFLIDFVHFEDNN
jgi:uncharacterized protein YxjI